MKQNWINNIHVEGYVFKHNLQNKIAKNSGVPFIFGDVEIATDASATNIVTVHFSYVTEVFSKSGKPNSTYPVLQALIDNNNTYELNGVEATRLRIDGRAEVNDFYTREGELASPKRVGGSFAHVMGSGDKLADKPATFELEMLLSGCVNKEVEDGDDYLELRGYAFNFRNDLLPLTLIVRDKGGIGYFESQDISNSNPMVTKVWGDIVSTTVVKETTVESAFGEPSVKASTRTIRSWDVVGASAEPMEWDDESTITKAELKEALVKREESLVEVKKRQDEYQASKNGQAGFPGKNSTTAAAPTKSSPTADEDFPF